MRTIEEIRSEKKKSEDKDKLILDLVNRIEKLEKEVEVLKMEILLKKGTKKDTISTQDGDHIGWSFFMSSTLNRSQNGNHFK